MSKPDDTDPTCDVFEYDTLVETILVTADVLSLLLGGVLAVYCTRLRRRYPEQLLLMQLGHLGFSDVAFACCNLFENLYMLAGGEIWTFCRTYIYIHRSLMVLSILYSLLLAVGLLYQLRRNWPVPRILWNQAPWLAVVLAFLLNVAFLVQPSEYDTSDAVFLCRSSSLGSVVQILVIFLIFFMALVIHLVMVGRAWGSQPHSVIRRSLWHACKYFIAFTITYTIHVVYHFDLWTIKNWDISCDYQGWRVVGSVLARLNGFFNFIAFCIHLIAVKRGGRPKPRVAFREDAAFLDVVEVSLVEPQQRAPWQFMDFRVFAAGADQSESEEEEEEIGSFLRGELFSSMGSQGSQGSPGGQARPAPSVVADSTPLTPSLCTEPPFDRAVSGGTGRSLSLSAVQTSMTDCD